MREHYSLSAKDTDIKYYFMLFRTSVILLDANQSSDEELVQTCNRAGLLLNVDN